ncbi:hypothetical protein ES707_13961 [subsurface metagenome]
MESYFLRFYGRSDEEIRECIEEIKALGFQPVRFRIVDAQTTCNFFVPPEHQPVREVRLYFNTLEEAEALHCDEVKAVYSKWSMKNRPERTETIYRRPKEISFAVTPS